MRKIVTTLSITVSIIAVALMASCGKSGPTPLLGPSYLDSTGTGGDTLGSYGISFLYGTTPTAYSVNDFAGISTTGGQTICGMVASSANDSIEISIEVTSPSALSTSITYTDTSLVYNAIVGIGTTSGATIGFSEYATNPNVKVNFSAITSKYVKGTFSGNIAAAYNGPVTAITKGSFYLPIQ